VRTVDRLGPAFVEEVPERLDPGVLYVSVEHGSMIHLCACGCGAEMVLPLTPLDWRFTYDGENVSVSPSVGSWSLACRSHYVIDRGRVRWAGDWSKEEVAANRARDRRRREERHGAPPAATPPPWADSTGSEQKPVAGTPAGLLARLCNALSRIWTRN
jgi:hypothetical protein